MAYELNLSVHDIVDVLLRKGHLDNRIFNQSSMEEGSRLHALYQGEQGENYLSEYPLEYTFQNDDYVFHVSGKADGVIFSSNGDVTVEEIKTTVADLDDFIHDHGQWHLSQAMFYAYILAKQRNLSAVRIVMTYLKQSNYHISKKITQVYTLEELSSFINDVILRYAAYIRRIQKFKEERNATVKNLSFPFTEYRDGQKQLMAFVDQACDTKKQVFVEAPTGIGKTISILYPLVKRFGEGKADRIFYLTSKNSIKRIAMATLSLFINQKVRLKAIEFTSQENICLNDRKGHCNPDECPFARHYYDKLLEAIIDSLSENDLFDKEAILKIAYEKTMCPYQFQMDLSRYCDVLVCDYTYVFDAADCLCLSQSGIERTHTFLAVDECHNLPERVRDMYSIEIPVKEFDDALTLCQGKEFVSLRNDLVDILSLLSKVRVNPEDPEVLAHQVFIVKVFGEMFSADILDILTDLKELLKKYPSLVSDSLRQFFFDIFGFYYLSTLVGDEKLNSSFLCYYRVSSDGSVQSLRIANLNSKPFIQAGTGLFEASVFFSATLSPRPYYIDLLGGNPTQTENQLVLPMPFPMANRRVFIDTNLSLRYKDRDKTIFEVFSLIKTTISQKKGNYFIFCPSYDYLENLKTFLEADPLFGAEIFYQGKNMSETERGAFLDHFQADSGKLMLGVLVIGGIFSEGIDLIGDRLIGAIVISVGLPQISFERDHIKAFYDLGTPEGVDPDFEAPAPEAQRGFFYAYTYPGINRILQAAGRVIRSETDHGILLFIDSRFRYNPYSKIMAEAFPDATKVVSASELRYQLHKFWGDKEK